MLFFLSSNALVYMLAEIMTPDWVAEGCCVYGHYET